MTTHPLIADMLADLGGEVVKLRAVAMLNWLSDGQGWPAGEYDRRLRQLQEQFAATDDQGVLTIAKDGRYTITHPLAGAFVEPRAFTFRRLTPTPITPDCVVSWRHTA